MKGNPDLLTAVDAIGGKLRPVSIAAEHVIDNGDERGETTYAMRNMLREITDQLHDLRDCIEVLETGG